MIKNTKIKRRIEDILFATSSNDEMIEVILQIIGVNSSTLGYDYIKESVLRLLSFPNLVNIRVVKEVYCFVAEEFEVENWRKVERAIRYSVNAIFENSNISDERKQIRDYIFIDYADDIKITNTKFLFTLARFIKDINNIPR